jgi:hypothetical protein
MLALTLVPPLPDQLKANVSYTTVSTAFSLFYIRCIYLDELFLGPLW